MPNIHLNKICGFAPLRHPPVAPDPIEFEIGYTLHEAECLAASIENLASCGLEKETCNYCAAMLRSIIDILDNAEVNNGRDGGYQT